MAHADRVRRARSSRAAVFGLVIAIVGGALTAAGPADARPAISTFEPRSEGDPAGRGWVWPVGGFRLENPYEAPAHRYGAGHRGIDVRPLESTEVRAPAGGLVAFSGRVADRGILTIDHGDGLVTTLEPIDSVLTMGAVVERGAPVGTVGLGGHTAAGAIHFGVRLHGEYINPLLLLGRVPRAVLLPCC